MKFKNTIGIDLGKENIHFTVMNEDVIKIQSEIANKPKQLELFLKGLGVELHETLFCMEYTGIYSEHILKVLYKLKANIWMERAGHIKKSIGLTRGKNDSLDSKRIAEYARRHQDNARLWKPDRDVIQKMKLLLSQRSRLVKAKKLLEVPINESREFIDKKNYKLIKVSSKASITAINKDLNEINEQIKELINSDEKLKQLNEYVTSVPNVGPVISASVIVATKEFEKITDPKKFACHCGVAPFEHQSGKSIRGKTRVSHLADKSLKTLFHLAAICAISHKGEFKDYFDRKVSEGKNKMLVINAVRNKLIHRVFACVNNQRKYLKNHLELA
jgi:transposase